LEFRWATTFRRSRVVYPHRYGGMVTGLYKSAIRRLHHGKHESRPVVVRDERTAVRMGAVCRNPCLFRKSLRELLS